MSRLVDYCPEDEDEVHNLNNLSERTSAPSASSAITATPGPRKALVPKSTVKPSTRKVRRLGGGKPASSNRLFQKLDLEEDERPAQSLARQSPRKKIEAYKNLESQKPSTISSSAPKLRPFRLNKPFPKDQAPIDESAQEQPSSDTDSDPVMESPLPKKRTLKPVLHLANIRLDDDSLAGSLSDSFGGETGIDSANTTNINSSMASKTIDEEDEDSQTDVTPNSEFHSDSGSVYNPDEAAQETDDLSNAEPTVLVPKSLQQAKTPKPVKKTVSILTPKDPNKTLREHSQVQKEKRPQSPPAERSESPSHEDADELVDALANLQLEAEWSAATAAPPRPSTPTKATGSKTLVSPLKQSAIPSTPHRPSTDSFWSQDVVNDWNDQHSPRKRFPPPTIVKQSNKPSPQKEMRRAFLSQRDTIAKEFLKELDEKITEGKVAELAESTGGVLINWSKTLQTTAGRATWKRETVTSKAADGSTISTTYKHHASIQLAEKVIDDEAKLLNVVAHEFCHLANYMVTGITTNPHGKEFKVWAAKCSKVFKDRGIVVTTKHSYDIDFKYVWECTSCGVEYKRHSKSINPDRHRCSKCPGKLQQTRPTPRNQNGPSEYQLFFKEQMKVVRQENPGKSQKEIMKIISERWAEKRAGGDVSMSAMDMTTADMTANTMKADETVAESMGNLTLSS